MFDYEQHKEHLLDGEHQMLVDGQPEATAAPKKIQSTQARRGKRASLTTAAAQPIPLNLAATDKNDGSFAVADLSGPHVKTSLTADGKISLTLKCQESGQVSAVASHQASQPVTVKRQASSSTSKARKPRSRKNAQLLESKKSSGVIQQAQPENIKRSEE
jgi:hypothetical protein